MRDLAAADRPFLRNLASRLADAERAVVRGDSLLGRLAGAASTLRELGRQLIAVKAENVAGRDRDPGVMLAEVPLRFDAGGGEGRMQMFYRKGDSGKGGWSSRVILDLNTTNLGPVLGDMRFFGKDMTLNLFVEQLDAAAQLLQAAGGLAAALREKGFRLEAKFMVFPPPSPPEPRSEGPETPGAPDAGGARSAASSPAPVRNGMGRLDTRA